MAGARQPSDNGRKLFRHPTEDEKRALDAGLTDALERAIHVSRYPALDAIPIPLRDNGIEGRNLKVVLDVTG
jgi:hypothetical protein